MQYSLGCFPDSILLAFCWHLQFLLPVAFPSSRLRLSFVLCCRPVAFLSVLWPLPRSSSPCIYFFTYLILTQDLTVSSRLALNSEPSYLSFLNAGIKGMLTPHLAIHFFICICLYVYTMYIFSVLHLYKTN